ncbi:UNVERIFIED_CONTAM: hypothetical protein K2H54_042307 [Gekko kuhli]
MTWETGPEKTESELQKHEEDPTKAVRTDFKKVSHLDITLLCSICHEAVHIRQFFHHKRAHQAQAALGYQRPWTETLDINKLALRQKELILRMIHSKYTEQEAHKINFSFEFLKETLKIAPYFCINSVEQSSVHTKEVSNPVIKAMAICQDRNALWRANFEDVFVILDNYGNRPGTCFFGLFDGSNGISAAETTSAELPLLLLDQLSRIDSSYQVNEAEQQVLDSFHTVFRADYSVREKFFTSKTNQTKKLLPSDYKGIHKAYAKSFWRMDRLLRLGRNELSRIRWSSCSAATCLVEKIVSEKQHRQTQEGEEILQRISGENERNIMKQEELPDNTSTVDEKSIIAQQEGAPSVSNEKTSSNDQKEEEPLEKINEEEKTIVEDSECFISNEDRFQEHQVTKSNSSTESEEGSAGIMHIANVASNGLWEVLDKDEVVTLALIMYSAFLEQYQHAQLQKSSMAKRSKLDKEDSKDFFFSWYLKPDSLFSEGDLEEDDMEQNSTEIRSLKSSGSMAEEKIPSGSLVGRLSDQKLESPSEVAVESSTLSEDTSSSEDTEMFSSNFGSQTSSEESQLLDEQHVSGHFESTDSQESFSQTEDEETDATTFYAHAAKYISKHLVKAALRAGSRDNISVLVTLLNGCDKIPTYV